MPSNLVIVGMVAIGVGSAAVIDLKTRRVPNALTITLAACGFGAAASGLSGLTVGAALSGFALGLVLMLPGHILGATGAGDVKLFAALGALVGPRPIATAFVYTVIAGGALALGVAIKRGLFHHTMNRVTELVVRRPLRAQQVDTARANTRFAYAPAIAVGTMLAALGL